ncbi:MAG: universal stress protein [Haloferacaceae archaeon]
MYDRILFPTDGSEGADAVLDRAVDVAAAHDATLHVLTVADTTHDSVTRIGGDVVDVLEREGERIVEEAAARADRRGVETVTDVLQGGVPETIAAYARKYDVDLIVVPTSGKTGLERLFLGSVAESVIRRSTVPVLALRPGEEAVEYPYREVLVPTDGSEGADAALERGVEATKTHDGSLHLLSVVEVGGLGFGAFSTDQEAELEADARRVVEEAAEVARRNGVESVNSTVERASAVHEAIASYVRAHDVDLVVIGTRGRTDADAGDGQLLGGVVEKTVRTAPVPVLTVPRP